MDSSVIIVSHFCHNCNQTIDILDADFKCSDCHSGFVEEIVETPKKVSLYCFMCQEAINTLGADSICGRCGSTCVQFVKTPEKGHKIEKEEQMSRSKEEVAKEECSICLMSMESTQKSVTLVCKHVFHKECVKEWFRVTNSCPLCRSRVDVPSIITPVRPTVPQTRIVQSRNVRMTFRQRWTSANGQMVPQPSSRPLASRPQQVSSQMQQIMSQITRDVENLRTNDLAEHQNPIPRGNSFRSRVPLSRVPLAHPMARSQSGFP